MSWINVYTDAQHGWWYRRYSDDRPEAVGGPYGTCLEARDTARALFPQDRIYWDKEEEKTHAG